VQGKKIFLGYFELEADAAAAYDAAAVHYFKSYAVTNADIFSRTPVSNRPKSTA
jgi:hypothetical protein